MDDKGRFLIQLKKYQKGDLNMAISLDQDSPISWLCKGKSLQEKIKHVEAISAFESTLKLDSKNEKARIGKGRSLNMLKI